MRLLLLNLLILVCLGGCVKDDPMGPPMEEPEEPSDELPRIDWDQSTLTLVSEPGSTIFSGYARLIELENGNLMVVYENIPNIIVKTSTDKGRSWSEPTIIAEGKEGVNMATPDLLQLNDGTILLTYNPRPTVDKTENKFAIRTIRSTDNGVTWKDDMLVYEAGDAFENGCWEPSLLQLPDGEVQLYFSDEGVYTSSSEQNISYFRSMDNGVSWNETPQIASFARGRRDGMPKSLYLENEQTIVCSIEDNRVGQFKPSIVRTTLDDMWSSGVSSSSSDRSYALKKSLSSSIYAGAPYLAKYSDDVVLLSYQSTERKTKNGLDDSEMAVCVGNGKALDFINPTFPFKIASNKHGLWNSVAVLKDKTVIALTSTNAFSTVDQVWMIKGELKE